MLKKTLLKNTYEFLEKNFSENIFHLKKYNKKRVEVLPSKGKLLKNKLLKTKLNFNRTLKKPFTYNTILKNTFSKYLLNNKLVEQISLNNISKPLKKKNTILKLNIFNKYASEIENNFFVKKNSNSLFSMGMIKSEFEKKQIKNSYFKNKLKEKKKLSILYGNISSNLIKKKIHKACKISKNYAFPATLENNMSFFENKNRILNGKKEISKSAYKVYTVNSHFITLLESRLDVILYRAHFFPTIKSAKKWISSSKILVNSKCINIPSYILNFGDIVSIKKANKKTLGNNILKFYIKNNKVKLNQNLLPTDNKKNFQIKKNNLFYDFKEKLIFNLIYSFHKNLAYFKKYNLNKYKHLFLIKNKITKYLFLNNLSYNKKILFKYRNENINNLNLHSTKLVCAFLNNAHFYFKNNINKFKLKNRYVISNFYFILLKNQIKPINKFLLSLNINKLFITYKINLFLQFLKKNAHFFSEKYEKKKNIYFFFEKHNLNNKFEILLNIINRKIITQCKKIIPSLLNNNFFTVFEKKNLKKDNAQFYRPVSILADKITKQQLNNIKKYDLLFFLKLKKFFFRKNEKNKRLAASKTFSGKQTYAFNNFKPLNLEISYKTLTIVHLYPSQKIIFPCTLDLAVLTKNFV